MLLDVVHIAEAAEVIRGQSLLAERIEVDSIDVELAGEALVGRQIEAHGWSTTRVSCADDRAASVWECWSAGY